MAGGMKPRGYTISAPKWDGAPSPIACPGTKHAVSIPSTRLGWGGAGGAPTLIALTRTVCRPVGNDVGTLEVPVLDLTYDKMT